MFGRLVDMATRTLIIDLSKGTGGEPMYGMVTVQRTRATSEGTFEVLPWETKLKLFNGIATITEAVTDGSGPFYDSAYLIRVQNGYCAPRWGFMAALPDGTTPISTGDMPKVNPITGEGIYMDAQEWNELYGDLPDRVTSLETGKANTLHTHVIGDVTGLQPALNAKGNATMRVDTSVGTRAFVSNGTTERMVSGDTGWRNVTPANGWSGLLFIRRLGNVVDLRIEGINPVTATSPILYTFPAGFNPAGVATIPRLRGVVAAGAGTTITIRRFYVQNSELTVDTPLAVNLAWQGQLSGITSAPWPTTLPGTPA